MEWIDIVSNNDNVLDDITITNSCIKVKIKLWNGGEKFLDFINYTALKEKNSIGREIGDIVIQTQSQLLEELMLDSKNDNGTSQELIHQKSFVFFDAWNNIDILEILAESVIFSDA